MYFNSSQILHSKRHLNIKKTFGHITKKDNENREIYQA